MSNHFGIHHRYARQGYQVNCPGFDDAWEEIAELLDSEEARVVAGKDRHVECNEEHEEVGFEND